MDSTIAAPKRLDLGGLPPAEGAARLLSAFDVLEPGDRLNLSCPDAWGELLRALQAERKGLFEWSLLEPGPPVWRFEVVRRRAGSGTRRSVREALAWDHDRLDTLEEAAFQSRKACDEPAAHDLYVVFAAGLRRHIGFEEDLLFPAFEQRTGMPPTAGPTAVMRAEHLEIRALLDRIEAGIADATAPVEPLRASFRAVMADHNAKEEQVLYPATDDLLGEEDADRLVSSIQQYGA